MDVIDEILSEWSYRCHDGIVDMNDPKKVFILNEILKKYNIDNLNPTMKEVILFLDNKYGYLIGMSVPPVMTAQIAHQIYLQWLSKIR
jgi:hypothetical protein